MTRRLYYEDSYMRSFRAKVVKVERVGERYWLVLDATAFYPGGGGQPHDTGVLKGSGWVMRVERAFERDGEVVHEGVVEGDEPSPSEEVTGEIDWGRRYRLMRMHTAAHVLGYAVKKLFGMDVSFCGSMLDVDESHCDFTTRITRADLPKLSEVIEEVVKRDLPVKIIWMGRGEAEEYLKRFGEALTELHAGIERVRVVEIEGLYAVPCGGTHVKRTGEVDGVKLLKRESKGRGVTRVRYSVE